MCLWERFFLCAILLVSNQLFESNPSVTCSGDSDKSTLSSSSSSEVVFESVSSTSSAQTGMNITKSLPFEKTTQDRKESNGYLNSQNTCPADPGQQYRQCEDMRMETELSVITLNCWGIRFISKDRVPRMTAIAEELATGKYDFVFLQEVWTTEDYERIKGRTGDVLPYSHYFFSGVIGAGICIFSKSPIKSAFFHQWAVNGYIHKIQHGDWFGGKGIGMVEVDHRGLKINLYTAHLHAEYDRSNDEYIAHRVTQAFDTAQFISMTSKHADVVIVGGDLNTEPGDLTYRLMFHTARLKDACEEVGKKMTQEQINTCETARNSYTSPSSLKMNPYGKRIDYVAFKGGNNFWVNALSCETPLPDRVPGQPFSYSDHEAVVTKLRISKYSGAIQPPFQEESKKEALEEGVEICDHAINHLQSTKNMYMLLSIAMFVLLSMTSNLQLNGYLSPVVPLLRIIIVFIMFFGIFMSVIWHRMEVHGILAGKLGMLLELGKPILPSTEVLPENAPLLSGGVGSGDIWTDVDPKDCLP